jgi:hypothetical protein
MNLIYFAAGYVFGGPTAPAQPPVPITASDWWVALAVLAALVVPFCLLMRILRRMIKAGL